VSQENVEIVRRSFEGFNARDVDELVGLSDPDCEWLPFRAQLEGIVSRTRRHPAICPRHGRGLGGVPD
jgi:ketosteroid isomerase-like protein